MKKINTLLLFTTTIACMMLASCSCKYTSTYTSTTHNRMLYGHDADQGFNLNKSKTPYATAKAKKPKSTPNRYKIHWWDKI